MTKTRHIRRKHKGGSFAGATRCILHLKTIGINRDKKHKWMEGYNAKKAELKRFVNKHHLANFSEEDFSKGTCSNLYDIPIDPEHLQANNMENWYQKSAENPANYYYIKGRDPNQTYTFEQAKERINNPNLPEPNLQEPTPDEPKPETTLQLQPPAILPGLLDLDDLADLGLDLDDEKNDNPPKIQDVIPPPDYYPPQETPPNQTRKNREPINSSAKEEDADVFRRIAEERAKNTNKKFMSDMEMGKKGRMRGGRGWFGLGKGFGKGFQHNMYYSNIKPNNATKKLWKKKYEKAKTHLAKMKAKYFDLTIEKYEKGLYPKNIDGICTKNNPHPQNYYSIEGWKGYNKNTGEYTHGEDLTYTEAKQRIDERDGLIKPSPDEPSPDEPSPDEIRVG